MAIDPAVASTLPAGAVMQWLAATQRQMSFDVEVSEGTADAVGERWRRDRCDVALFATRNTIDAPNLLSLWREPYVLVAASGHLVATRDRWSVTDLADTPFVLRAACEAHDEGPACLRSRRRAAARRAAFCGRRALRLRPCSPASASA
jgi:hypothetical protein